MLPRFEKYKLIAIASVVALLLGVAIMVSTGLYNSQDGVPFEPTALPTAPVVTPTQTPPINHTNNTTKPTPTPTPRPCYTLLFFEQPGCSGCEAQRPLVETWAASHKDRVTLWVVDIHQNPTLSTQYGIRVTPTTIMTSGGTALKTWVGEFNTAELTTWLNAH